MGWISKEEIQRRASASPYETFTVTIEFNEQFLRASEQEFREAYKTGKIGFDEYWCGPCIHYDFIFTHNHGNCPLADDERCCEEWKNFEAVLREWNAGNKTFLELQDATRFMLGRLHKERNKLLK